MIMPTTLTLKNIPDELYKRLKASAEAHRRSLNNEVIVCLETVLRLKKISVEERLARARALRSSLPKDKSQPQDIDSLKLKVGQDCGRHQHHCLSLFTR
jgi:plasmid stability protein